MADLHISERPADLATSDESDQSGLSLEAMDNTLPPEDVSSYHEPGLFIDFNDPPEVIAEELRDLDRDCDMLSDDDLDSDAETNSDTESSNGQSTNAASPESHNLDSSDLEGTSAQADEPEITHSPPASGPSNTRSSFSNLLDSLHAPGRGTYDIQCILEEGSEEMQGLKEQKAHIELLLAKAEQRCHEIRAHLEDSDKAFQALQEQNGISAELWREYEAFCESLEPQFGSRRGWSILCSEDHGNSYFQYDPDLTLLSQSAPISLQNHNFRCEAYTVVPTPQQQSVGEAKDCPEMQHVVKFWAVPPLKPRTGMETTWGDQYPDLYRLATRAFYDLARSETWAAWELLRSLPDPKASFSGGWLFEYKRDNHRATHPVESRRWVFSSAHKIEHSGDTFSESEEDPVTDDDAADDLRSDPEDAPADEETFFDWERKDHDIMDIFPSDSGSGMEDLDKGMDLD